MEKINVAELLKECPKGMELDCTMFNNVVLYGVNGSSYPISILAGGRKQSRLNLTKTGCCNNNPDAKCVIFPKGKTTWEGFQRPFKDGDIVFYDNCVSIFKEWGGETRLRTYAYTYLGYEETLCQEKPVFGKDISKEVRFATEEEKQKLFDSIKANGYKWNPETKTLEELPKFKVGDKIEKCGYRFTITEVKDDYYLTKCGNKVPFDNQADFSLVQNKFDTAILETEQKPTALCDVINAINAGCKSLMEETIKVDISAGYEFAGVDNQQVVFEKIGCQYPKTYEECCDVLKIEYPYFKTEEDGISASTYKNKLFGDLKQLLICRDAYWKIAGEEMGLDEPWKPDWDDENEFKYGLYHFRNGIMRDGSCINSTLLAFPTEEMRDAFLENFGHLIEPCKKLYE